MFVARKEPKIDPLRVKIKAEIARLESLVVLDSCFCQHAEFKRRIEYFKELLACS